MRRPAVEAKQRRVGTALIDEDELLRVVAGDCGAPGGARFLVALAGCHRFFLCVQPRRRMARHMAISLTACPTCSAHQAQCSRTVASGAASSRVRRSASCSPGSCAGRQGWACAPADRLALLYDRPFHGRHGHAKPARGFSHGLTLGHRAHQAFFQVNRIGTHTRFPPQYSCLFLLFVSCSKARAHAESPVPSTGQARRSVRPAADTAPSYIVSEGYPAPWALAGDGLWAPYRQQ